MGEPDLVEDILDVDVAGERIALESRSDRGAEQQIDRYRRVGVVAVGIEALYQMPEIATGEALGQHPAGFEHLHRRRGLTVRIETTAQSEQVDILIEVNEPQNLRNSHIELRRVAYSGLPVIDPIGRDVVFD